MGKKEPMDRFIGENFHTWQTRLKFLLQKKELWKFISSDASQIPTTREAKAQWDLADTKTLSIIALNLGDQYLHHISNLDSAKSAWETLDQLFGATCKNAKINLKLQLFKLNMNPGDSFPIHLNEFKSILSQLASIKAPMDEDDCIALLLKSMPEEYDIIVTTLLNMPNLKLHEVESSLMDEHKKRQGRVFIGDQAYYSKNQHKFNKGFNNKKGGTPNKQGCGFCGKDNHKEEDCFHKRRAQKAYFASIKDIDKEADEGEPETSNEANLVASLDDDDQEWAF